MKLNKLRAKRQSNDPKAPPGGNANTRRTMTSRSRSAHPDGPTN
jgi:hypothetical protein